MKLYKDIVENIMMFINVFKWNEII